MTFELNFDICQPNCELITFNDTTGEYIEGVNQCCKSGYGYPGNPIKSDILSTELSFTYPNGDVYGPLVDLYTVPLYACASFEILSTDPSGSIAVMGDNMMIGYALLIDSETQMINDLIADINANNKAGKHTYQASANGSVITICDLCGGLNSNGKMIMVCPFMVVVDNETITLSGANSSTGNCIDITSGQIDQTDIVNCFDDGVYEVTYTVYEDDAPNDPIEHSVTKKFLFDCRSNECLRALILLAARPDCPCNDKDLHKKIQELRTDIESARVMFEECQYDSANELIQKTQTFCTNVCLDCE